MKVRLMCGAALIAAAGCSPAGGDQETRDMSPQEVAAELAGVQIEPGLWEVTSEVVNVSGEGMPREVASQMIGHRTTAENCITPEQAARPDANFLTAQEDSDCTYRDFSMRGGRLTGTMTCSGGEMPGEMTTRMEGQYGPRSYDMTMHMETAGMPEGADMSIEARVSGRRAGECPAGGAGGQ